MPVKKTLLLGLAALSLAFAAASALADTTIKVNLWDKSGTMEMDMTKSMGMGMGMGADMTKAIMGIEMDKTSVPAGKVTFEVVNNSKDTMHDLHEAIVVPITGKEVVLPYNANENRVDEEASGDLGEVADLEPGKSGTLTLDLKPGLYAVYCNIPGHYMAGMWTTLEVK